MGGKQLMRNKLGAPCGFFSPHGWEAVRPCEPPASICPTQWSAPCWVPHVCGFFSPHGWEAVRPCEPPASICPTQWSAPCWVPHPCGFFSPHGWEAVRPCEPPASICPTQWSAPCWVPRMGGKQYARASLPRASAPRSGLLHAMVRRAAGASGDRLPLIAIP